MADEMKVENIQIGQFFITDEAIETFSRITTRYGDCVPNALFLLGAIDATTTDVIKILTEDVGMSLKKTENLFKYLLSEKAKKLGANMFSQVMLSGIDKKELYNFCISSLMPSHSIFCILERIGSPIGHAFLIARKNDGRLVVLDGQRPGIICDIKDCWGEYVADIYHVLKYELA